jgi:hypothetical protein
MDAVERNRISSALQDKTSVIKGPAVRRVTGLHRLNSEARIRRLFWGESGSLESYDDLIHTKLW